MRTVLRFFREFAGLYTNRRLPRASAALSYYLTMTFFPVVIILYTMLGNSYAKAMEIVDFARNFIAAETVETISEFLRYVADNNSMAMMMAAIAVIVTSASAAVRSLQATIGEMQGQLRYQGVMGFVFSVIFSLLFVAALYLAMILMMLGGDVIAWLNDLLPFVDIGNAWKTLRFLLLAGIVYLIVWGVYEVSKDRRDPYPTRVGALISTLAMVGVSIAFSVFIGASVRYPLVYGSLASIILLMFWLYTACLVIYCGAAVNVTFRNMKREKHQTRFAPRPAEEAPEAEE